MSARSHGHPDHGFLHPVPSEITPAEVYAGRRQWLRQLAAGTGGAVLASWAARDALAQAAASSPGRPGKLAPLPGNRSAASCPLATVVLANAAAPSTST